jgi:hypothetical protein
LFTIANVLGEVKVLDAKNGGIVVLYANPFVETVLLAKVKYDEVKEVALINPSISIEAGVLTSDQRPLEIKVFPLKVPPPIFPYIEIKGV